MPCPWRPASRCVSPRRLRRATSRAAPDGPPAHPLSASICSPVAYGGPGRPQFLIVAHSAFQGTYKGHGVQTAQAIKMVLAERGWRAGEYTVGMQACEETDAKTGVPSPEKCAPQRAGVRARTAACSAWSGR